MQLLNTQCLSFIKSFLLLKKQMFNNEKKNFCEMIKNINYHFARLNLKEFILNIYFRI